MLNVTPEIARNVLNFVLSATQVFAAIGLAIYTFLGLGALLSGRELDFNQSYSIALNAHITLLNKNSFSISGLDLPVEPNSDWQRMLILFGIFFTLAAIIYVAGYLKKLLNKIIDDPFQSGIAPKFRIMAYALLSMQLLEIIYKSILFFDSRGREAQRMIENTFGSLAAIKTVSVSRSLFPNIDFSPLWAALALILLAAVFQRGHDLREQERSLRLDQELTV
ncbi:hypothetical protein [Deinococcus puniceus]|uniref:DUF2975 domain-containing protein n=1 Tax=Deinococcus puniceus TaxID=1182568 RepID=A0A172T7Y4_9DEIO|nr:hypothetical protein [Deinococcus puniceus]ANE43145.1 hypothetical protein SU48_04485 [Deinococcus puniceus]